MGAVRESKPTRRPIDEVQGTSSPETPALRRGICIFRNVASAKSVSMIGDGNG